MRLHKTLLTLCCTLLFVVPAMAQSTSQKQTGQQKAAAHLEGTDLRKLPVAEGNITTAGPKRDFVYICSMDPLINGPKIGAFRKGDWIHDDGTFDASAKPHVEGNVEWPDHKITFKVEDGKRNIYTNDLPADPTGEFPVKPGTRAYDFDRNPNTIKSQNLVMGITAEPAALPQPVCLPAGGPVGIMLNGSELFLSLDAIGRNAVAYEVQDHCWGHPEITGSYHYHSLTPCMDLGDKKGTSPMMAYALDGYGIYGPYQDGKLLTNKDLDECHGTTSEVMWEGKKVSMYHYVANFEFPYTLGCYKAKPLRLPPGLPMRRPGGPGGPGDGPWPPPGGMRPPPPPGMPPPEK